MLVKILLLDLDHICHSRVADRKFVPGEFIQSNGSLLCWLPNGHQWHENSPRAKFEDIRMLTLSEIWIPVSQEAMARESRVALFYAATRLQPNC